MKRMLRGIIRGLETLRPLPLLFFRLVLAYGFYGPAIVKFQSLSGVIDFFKESNILYPELSAYLTMIFEGLGVILLFLGLFTRLISIPLMVIMGGAITMVHWSKGFHAAGGGYEIPLYYFLMLFALFVLGPGKISLDALIKRKISRQPDVTHKTERPQPHN